MTAATAPALPRALARRPSARAPAGPALRRAALAAAALAALAGPAQALTEDLRLTLGGERVQLPGGERMGLAGASLLFDAGAGWWLGPAVYGAATGERGGFYVGGVELQRRWRLAPATELAAGLYAGGGGGAAAPVGGGLMLRPALTLWQDLGPLQAGLGWSQVRFPSGEIRSSQWSLLLGWRHGLQHQAPGAATPASRSGLGFDRVALTGGHYRVTNGGADRGIGLVGMRAERDLAWPGWVAGVEAAAAASGDAAGYMEILAHLGWQAAPLPQAWPSLRVGLRGALGLGGGGAMPMGGGTFGKATATVSFRPLPGWTLGADLGRAHGDPLRARSAQLWLAADLEPVPGAPAGGARPAVRTEWVASVQHHDRVARNSGPDRALAAVGLALNRYLGPHLYVSGQAHSAFDGGAGAYSIGLLGLGLATADDKPWRVGAELLAGAAGGGGVRSGGGAVWQAKGWAGWSPVPEHELRLGLGGLRSRSGALSTPVVELSWSRRYLIGG